ncbi:MAG: Lrp/AsnC family transcriptional regulator, partial [archaeon]
MQNNNIELDLIDRKILYELDINSRISITKLSKKIKVNRNVIEYRLKRLTDREIIKNYVTLIDAGKLGFMVWNIYLKFQNTTQLIENKILNYLKENRLVWWAGQTTGSFDLIYSVGVKNIKEFYEIVEDINSNFGNYILTQTLAAHCDIEIFSRGYFLNKPSLEIGWYKDYNKVILKKKDIEILKILGSNSRMSSVDLAKKTNLTPRIVAYKIKDLLKRGIITRFRIAINSKIYGYSFYKVIIHLKNLSKEKDMLLKEYCRNLGFIIHYERKIGPWMLELELECRSYEEINKV